jgi:ribose transport system substrate-binding protein
VAAALLTAFAMAAAGCGDSGDSNAETGDSPTSGAKADKKFTIAFSTYAGVIPFYRATNDGFKDAADKLGWDYRYTDSNFDPAKQVSDITDLLTQGADLIAVSPGDEEALVGGYREAKNSDVSIWSYINDISADQQDLRQTWFHVDWSDVADKRGRFMLEKMGGSGKVIAIRGPSAVLIVRQYQDGFERAMKTAPGAKLAFAQNAQAFTPEEGLRLTQDALTAHPDVKAIWVDNDDMALGVVQAVQEAHLGKNDVVIVSGDGTNAAVKLVEEGWLDYTVIAPGYEWASDVVKAAQKFLVNGEDPPATVDFKLIDVTPDNAAELLATCPTHPKEVYCRT